jgi:hypothetical protein
MDGLSVGASVAGLVQVASKVVQFISTMSGASSTARNVLAEARSLQAILHQLQDFIIRFDQGLHDQRSMIYVNQLVTTLTGCVCAFNDLEKVLDSLNTSHDASALLRLWCSAKWALKDPDLSRILGDLQKHKSSLNLMLTIITWLVTKHSKLFIDKLNCTTMRQRISAYSTTSHGAVSPVSGESSKDRCEPLYTHVNDRFPTRLCSCI